MVEKLLPQNMEAEVGVLGSILIDPEKMDVIAEFLLPEDFYRDAHRTIYQAIYDLYQRRRVADLITLCDVLAQRNRLEECGGPAYISSLINTIPTSVNAEDYARIVQRAAVRRRLIQAAGDIAALAYEEEIEDTTQMLEEAERRIFEISQRFTLSQTADMHLREIMKEYMVRLDDLISNRGAVTGVPTGFADLDRLLGGGLQRSDLVVVAARPGVGKSSFAISLAHNAAKKYSQRLGIFSLEMSRFQMAQRLIAINSGVNLQRLKTGWMEDDELATVIDSMGKLAGLDIWIDDTPGASLQYVRSRARRWVTEYGIQALIVDYLQLMEVGGERKNNKENREQEVARISRGLKGLSRELNIPVLALAQLSRAVEGRQSKIPQLSDLRESGAIENDADIVAFIYRDDMNNPESERKNMADLLVAKHRQGELGTICMYVEPHLTHFKDLIASPPGWDENE